jgi:hypothetical protein
MTLAEDAESGGLKVFPRLAHSRITQYEKLQKKISTPVYLFFLLDSYLFRSSTAILSRL